MLCRILVKVPGEKDESPTFLKPRLVPEISDSTRRSWVNGIKQFVGQGAEYQHVRPLDFILFLDGSVEYQASSDPTATESLTTAYPSPYCIPQDTITDLESAEKIRRAELFALASLIYEIHAGEAPFEDLEDGEIQAQYRRAQFPEVTHLPQWPIMLSCWSVEFASGLYASLST